MKTLLIVIGLCLLLTNACDQPMSTPAQTIPERLDVTYDHGEKIVCDGLEAFAINPNLIVKPDVRIKGIESSQLTTRVYLCRENAKFFRISHGKREMARVVIDYTSGHLKMRLYSLFSAQFYLSAQFESPLEITPMDHDNHPVKKNVSRFYPYNWLSIEEEADCGINDSCPIRGAKPDLISPGFKMDDMYVSADTQELQRVDFKKIAGEKSVAQFYLSRVVRGSVSDKVAYGFSMKPGDLALNISFLLDSSLTSLMNRRNHLNSEMAIPSIFDEKIFQIHYNSWSSKKVNLTLDELRAIASQLKETYTAVIVHTANPEFLIDGQRTIAQVLWQDYNLKAYIYRFFGAGRGTIRDPLSTVNVDSYPSDFFLRLGDQSSSVYNGGNGLWLNLDLRQTRVRQRLITEAQSYVRDYGWHGIFFDAPLLWVNKWNQTDEGGVPVEIKSVGGRSDIDTHYQDGRIMSYAYSRWLTLYQIKKAIREINPKAVVGALQPNLHYDHLNVLDYTSKESVYGGNVYKYDDKGRILAEPNVYTRQSRITLVSTTTEFLEKQKPWITSHLVFGNKVLNPMLNCSAKLWANLGTPPSSNYTDLGTLFRDEWENVLRYAQVAKGQADPTSSCILEVSPVNTKLYNYGPSLISSSKNVTLNLTKSSPYLNLTDLKYLGYKSRLYLNSTDKYVVAERFNEAWRYSDQYFAWRRGDRYLFGALRFLDPPITRNHVVYLNVEILDSFEGVGAGELHIYSPGKPQVKVDGTKVTLTSIGSNSWQGNLVKALGIQSIGAKVQIEISSFD